MARKQKEEVLYDTDWYAEDVYNGVISEDEDDLNWYDFKENLKVACEQHQKYCNHLIGISSVGTWRGRFVGYSKATGNDVYEFIMKLVGSGYDRVKIYLNENGDLELALSHHDGTNYVVIREFKDRYNDDMYIDRAENDLYNGKEDLAYKYTKSVKYIFKGWIF